MPEISLFYGIRVTMYYEDHNPPHFHAEYNGNKAIVDIIEARVIKGALPSRQLKLILAWCVIHQDELMQNWVSDGTLWEVQTALFFRWTCLPDCAVPELAADYRRNNRRLS